MKKLKKRNIMEISSDDEKEKIEKNILNQHGKGSS